MNHDLWPALRPRKGKCRVNDAGKNCQKEPAWRGICAKHYQYLNKCGLLDMFTDEAPRRDYRDMKVELVNFEIGGLCRLKVDERPCYSAVNCRGLCLRHYNIVKANGEIDRWCIPSKLDKDYSLNVDAPKGVCRIFVDDEVCDRKVFGRGLCHMHYTHFSRKKMLNEVGLPSKRQNKTHEGTKRMDGKKNPN